jgi:uncharacterized protein YuzE
MSVAIRRYWAGNWGGYVVALQILYDSKTDLLYLRLDERKQSVLNKRLSEDIVLDIGEDNKIVGSEILDASKHLNLEKLLPLQYEVSSLRRDHV